MWVEIEAPRSLRRTLEDPPCRVRRPDHADLRRGVHPGDDHARTARAPSRSGGPLTLPTDRRVRPRRRGVGSRRRLAARTRRRPHRCRATVPACSSTLIRWSNGRCDSREEAASVPPGCSTTTCCRRSSGNASRAARRVRQWAQLCQRARRAGAGPIGTRRDDASPARPRPPSIGARRGGSTRSASSASVHSPLTEVARHADKLWRWTDVGQRRRAGEARVAPRGRPVDDRVATRAGAR